jgi:hypothetical protein
MEFNTVSTARLSPLYFKNGGNTIVPVYILWGYHTAPTTKNKIFFTDTPLTATQTTYSSTKTTWWVTPQMSWKNSEYQQLPNYSQIKQYAAPLTDDQKRIVGLLAHVDTHDIYHIATIEEELKALKWLYTFLNQTPPDEAGMLRTIKNKIAGWMASAGNIPGTFMPVKS